ncbi:hypothetical protein FACS1894167_06520 [Synergistales bacterium]|nr:hypothetical protein FACS1894167_06520 [Synergistales bacterium]
MALLQMREADRMLEYDCIQMLPDLEDDVLSVDIIIPCLEDSFVFGMEDWWDDFVSDWFM